MELIKKTIAATQNGFDTEKTQKVIKGSNIKVTPEPKGLGFALYQTMIKNEHAVAQIDSITEVTDTYGNLLKRCIYTTLEMRARNIVPNDILAICSFNQLNSCVPVIASSFIGAIMSCFDPELSLLDTVHLLKQVKPKMIFVGPEAVELIEKAIEQALLETEIVVFGPSSTHSEFSEFLVPKNIETFRPIEIKNNKETVLLLFSSGTTGMPKGICINHYGLLGQAQNLISVGYNLKVCLSYSSFYGMSTTRMVIACMLAGGARLLVPKYDPTPFWKQLKKFKITKTFVAPTEALGIFNEWSEGINAGTQICDVIIGGGPISVDYLTKVRKQFPGSYIAMTYGQTEVSGVLLCFQPNLPEHMLNMQKKPGSAGMVMPGFMVKIVDPKTEKALGPYQKGEVRVKSEFVLNGFYNMDSSCIWDSEGWLKTGDIAYYDDEHYFYIVDRIKEMLKFQGWPLSPAVIEGVVLSHPSIAKAVVVGIPNEEDGEHPAAAVVLKDPNDPIQAVEIEKFVKERVDDKQRLRGGVIILKIIPKTATGKIRRGEVKKIIAQNHFNTLLPI